MSEYKDKLIELKEDLRELMLKAPELAKFGEFVKIAESTNVLDEKTKELITVGIAIALRCEPCIIEILGSKTPHFNARIQSRFVN